MFADYDDDVSLPVPSNLYSVFLANSFQLGRVLDLNDKTRFGVEIPSLYGTGEDRIFNWVETAGLPLGTTDEKREGDCGIYWPPVAGQYVLVGNIAGNPQHKFAIAGPPGYISFENDDPSIPKEVKEVMKKRGAREGTRIRMLKSEAGHTLAFSDNEGQEAAFLMDSTGQTFFMVAPGKGKSPKETKDTKVSYGRKSEPRRDRSVMDASAPAPGEATKDGIAYMGFFDLCGSGMATISKDGQGTLVIKASRNPGDSNPLSIVMDTKDNVIILTAGEAQFKVDGKRGHTYSTSQIVQEHQKVDTKPLINKIFNELKGYYKGIFGKD
jgi:hypothetical protein